MRPRIVELPLIALTALLVVRHWEPRLRVAAEGGVVFESTWSTAAGTSREAVTDGGRWPVYEEFNGQSDRQLMSVVESGAGGHRALRVEQHGPRYAARLQIDDVVEPSRSYYVRYYMRNEDTSGAGDHIVTVDAYEYPNLTFMRKRGGSAGWTFETSLYGCGYTYPIGHWGPTLRLANRQWYRFEYFVEFVDATHVRVHPRVYGADGRLIFSEADFRQSDYRRAEWNGRSDWTLASYYAAGFSFCVDPQWTNDFALGNNGQEGARDTGMAWYFSGVQVRTDRWPGPIERDGDAPDVAIARRHPDDAGIERDPDVMLSEAFESPTVASLMARWSDWFGGASFSLSDDVPEDSPGSQSLQVVSGRRSFGAAHLYRVFERPADTAYVRYYVKHGGVPGAMAAAVSMGGRTGDAQVTLPVDAFDEPFRPDEWTCVEQMVKLNDAGLANGEHAIWIDNAPVANWTGFRWRLTPRLRLNWLLLSLQPGSHALEGSAWMRIDDLVVARQRIGCLARRDVATEQP